jgi:hypothetical protein
MKRNLTYLVFLVGLVALLLPATASAATSFPECPAVGNDTTGCELLITVSAVNGSGAATAFTVTASSPDLGPYDGSDDTLVGILNSSGSILKSIGLTGTTDIFGFDGDGACTYITCTGATDPSGYAPAGVTFSGINASFTSGTVNFTGVAAAGSTWFSLEEALTPSSIGPSTPEPATFTLLGAGSLLVMFGARRRRRA